MRTFSYQLLSINIENLRGFRIRIRVFFLDSRNMIRIQIPLLSVGPGCGQYEAGSETLDDKNIYFY